MHYTVTSNLKKNDSLFKKCTLDCKRQVEVGLNIINFQYLVHYTVTSNLVFLYTFAGCNSFCTYFDVN